MTNNDQRAASKFPAAAMAVTALSVATVLGTVAYFTVGDDLLERSASREAIPSCTSPDVRRLLSKTVSNGSNAFQTRTFIDFSEVVERSYTPNVKRYCAGYLTDGGGRNYTGLELTLSSGGDVIGTLVPDYPRTVGGPQTQSTANAAAADTAEAGAEPEYSYLDSDDLALKPAEKLALFRKLDDLGEKENGEPWTAAELNEISRRQIELFEAVSRAAPDLITEDDQRLKSEAVQSTEEYAP